MRLFLMLAAFAATPALAQQAPITPVVPGPQAQPAATVMVEPVAHDDRRVRPRRRRQGQPRRIRPPGCATASTASTPRKTGSLGYIGYSDWSERWLGDRNTLPSPFETDRDGDNRITSDELSPRFDLLFARFDINKDGALAPQRTADAARRKCSIGTGAARPMGKPAPAAAQLRS